MKANDSLLTVVRSVASTISTFAEKIFLRCINCMANNCNWNLKNVKNTITRCSYTLNNVIKFTLVPICGT